MDLNEQIWSKKVYLVYGFKDLIIFVSQLSTMDRNLRNNAPTRSFGYWLNLLWSTFVPDLPASSVRDFLLPGIQNLLKDTDALDPAHKEALEIIVKERSGGTLDAISKVMGSHLGLASSMSSFFGEGGLLGKRETVDQAVPPPEPVPQTPVEDTRLRRIMRGGFSDMLRGKAKGSEDTPHSQS